jgi:hypothetical protein
LVDPHSTPLRAEPKDHRDLMVAALHGWVQAYDNLSAMPDWLSNGLCRLVTGGGISTRGLFTNHEEVVWSAHRPAILTSIDDIVQRPDVIDRSIFLPLRSIVPSRRRCEEDLWAEFMPDYPRIFGGLLDAVAAGMRLRPTVKLAELERMADFTRWGEAAAQGAGWAPGTFVTAYRANRPGSKLRNSGRLAHGAGHAEPRQDSRTLERNADSVAQVDRGLHRLLRFDDTRLAQVAVSCFCGAAPNRSATADVRCFRHFRAQLEGRPNRQFYAN